jgi:hypothetical protein
MAVTPAGVAKKAVKKKLGPKKQYSGKQAVAYKTGQAVRATGQAGAGAVQVTTKAAANDALLLSLLVVMALGFLNEFVHSKSDVSARKESRVRLFIAVGIVYITLAAVAQFSPKAAKQLALVVMVTAVLTEGTGVINLLTKRAGIQGTPNPPPVHQIKHAVVARIPARSVR